MSYKVLHDFVEKSHDNTLYKKGDTYPKAGFELDEERVAFLMKRHRKYFMKFLQEVKEKKTSQKSSKSTKQAPSKD